MINFEPLNNGSLFYIVTKLSVKSKLYAQKCIHTVSTIMWH